jgi:peptidoglycan L-alanyl-D-glutamate endopeptidase CwlK
MPPVRSIESLSFGSRLKLRSCDLRLQKIVENVIPKLPWGITVIYGFRNKDDQELAFRQGNTKLHYPKSKHNRTPSLAVDVAPMIIPGKIDWNDIESFKFLGAVMLDEAKYLGVILRWGADWNMNGVISEKGTFEWDFPHFEIVEKGETINGKVVA